MTPIVHRDPRRASVIFPRKALTPRGAAAKRMAALAMAGALVVLLLGPVGFPGAPAAVPAAADQGDAADAVLPATGNGGSTHVKAASPPRTVPTSAAANARRTPPRAILRGFGQRNGTAAGAVPAGRAENAKGTGAAGANSFGEAAGSTAAAGTSSAPTAKTPGTLAIGGAVIPYRDVRGGTTPATGAGLWLGSDATDDGSWGYFVGHNPGSFAPVRSLKAGDAVTLTDRTGKQRSYHVRSVLTVSAAATWKTVAPLVTGFGESILLQTCTGDGLTNTIVVAV